MTRTRSRYAVGLLAALVLLTLSVVVRAESLVEMYQAAVAAEKGQGDLEQAITLYERVVNTQAKQGGDPALAARAQIRLGLCRERLGLRAARQAYQQVKEHYPEQSQAAATAGARLQSLANREATLSDEPPFLEDEVDTVTAAPPRFRRSLGRQQRDSLAILLRTDSTGRAVRPGSGLSRLSAQVEALKAQAAALQESAPETAREMLAWAEQLAAMPADALDRALLPEYGDYAAAPPVVPFANRQVAQVPLEWRFLVAVGPQTDSQAGGVEYSQMGYDDSRWSRIQIGQAWEDQGYQGYDEGAWYRSQFSVEADDQVPVFMAFGGVDLHAYVYLNGQYVGSHHEWDVPFILDISTAVRRHDRNTVAIYVYDGYGMGGVYGLIQVLQPTGPDDCLRYVGSQAAVNRRMPRHGNRTAVGAGLGRGVSTASKSLYSVYAQAEPLIPYDHRAVARVPTRWRFTLDSEPFFRAEKGKVYSEAAFVDTGWAQLETGRCWEDQGYPDYDGSAWYRAALDVDAPDDRAPVLMAFGGIDEDAYVCLNGRLVGEFHQWDEPFILDISEAVHRHGRNTVAIYVYGGWGMGGIYGRINVHQPAGQVDVSQVAANRGGRVAAAASPNLLQRWLPFHLRNKEDYGEYAMTPPRVDYPAQSVAVVPQQWRFSTGLERRPGPSQPDFDDSRWPTIEIGRAWEDQGYAGYDRGAWYRAKVEVDAVDDSQPVYMAFGGVDKDAWVYVNGRFVGEHHEWDQPFTLDISPAVRRHGVNAIAVYVYDGMGMGGIYGLIDIHQRLQKP